MRSSTVSSRAQKGSKASFLRLFIWFLAVLFFFYEFFLRVLPATAAKHIFQGLDISIEQFALIGSGYYLTYSLMQFPVGILLDKFSTKFWFAIAVVTCAFGALWFSFAHSFFSALIARMLIGFGSAFGFIFFMVVTINWFPKKYFAFLTGCGQFLGALGPLFAGAPIALLLTKTEGNWRIIFFWVAVFGLIIAIAIGLFYRDKPEKKKKIVFIDKKNSLKKRLAALLRHPQIWWILLYSGFVYVTLPLLGAFWGASYLETRGFSSPTAALIVSMIWLGLALGSPVFGRLSDWTRRRKPLMGLCAILGITSSILFLWIPSQNPYFLGFLFFLLGVGGSGQNLGFAIITEHAPKNLHATALGMNNTGVMGFAAIIPPFVTSVIQSFLSNGQLTQHAFEKGFALIPLFFAIPLVLVIFAIKETFCRQQREIYHM